MKKKNQSARRKRVKAKQPQGDPISRGKGRRLLKTLAGAAIGGAIAGPVGVAAGAIAGASVRRGPVRRRPKSRTKAKPQSKSQAPGRNRAPKQRFGNIYPNIP